MPRCEIKEQWFDGFSDLSSEYSKTFSKISGGIYLSEYFFTVKQNAGMDELRSRLNA